MDSKRRIIGALVGMLSLLLAAPCAFAQEIFSQTVPVPVLPAGKQVVITYRATIDSDAPDNTTDVRALAEVNGDNFTPPSPVEAITPVVILSTVLGSPIHFLWNGFLAMQNVVAVINKDSAPLGLTIRMLSSEGVETGRTGLLLAPGAQFDIPVNSLPGFAVNTLGVLRLEFERNDFDGNGFYYRFAPDFRRLEYMLGDALRSGISGPSVVTFNTIQPSRRSSQLGNEVSNWLSLSNMGSAINTFTLQFYSQAGALIRTTSVSVPALGRRDVEAGHANPGANNVGLIRIVPADDELPYVGSLNRYGASGPASALAKFYHFALGSPARTGSSGTEYAPISRGGGGQNWVVISNAGITAGLYRATFLSNSGTNLGSVDLNIPAFGQQHLFANGVLGDGDSGVVQISSLSGDRFIAESTFYFFDSELEEVTAAYASVSRRPLGSTLTGSYNTYLDQFNFLKMFNTAGGPVGTTFILNSSDGSALGASGNSISSLHGKETPLHGLPFAPADNNFGQATLSTSQPGAVIAEILRYQASPDGRRIEAISSVPLR